MVGSSAVILGVGSSAVILGVGYLGLRTGPICPGPSDWAPSPGIHRCGYIRSIKHIVGVSPSFGQLGTDGLVAPDCPLLVIPWTLDHFYVVSLSVLVSHGL